MTVEIKQLEVNISETIEIYQSISFMTSFYTYSKGIVLSCGFKSICGNGYDKTSCICIICAGSACTSEEVIHYKQYLY